MSRWDQPVWGPSEGASHRSPLAIQSQVLELDIKKKTDTIIRQEEKIAELVAANANLTKRVAELEQALKNIIDPPGAKYDVSGTIPTAISGMAIRNARKVLRNHE